MMNAPRCRLSMEPRHGLRIDYDVRRQLRLDRPANHFPIEKIKDALQVQPTLVRSTIGQVGASTPDWAPQA